MEIKIQIASFRALEKPLISAKSYLIDRFTPAVEKITLPAYSMPEGEIYIRFSGQKITSDSHNLSTKRRWLTRLKNRFKATEINDLLVIDFRKNSPANWAHSLNFHIPFAFFLIEQLRKEAILDPYVFVLDEQTPGYIINAFKFFSLPLLQCDNTIHARQIEFKQSPFDSLRSLAYSWVQDYISKTESYQRLESAAYHLPKRVFLSRRGTRNLRNEDEIEKYLAAYGFEKKYPEDLSVEEQLQVFMNADAIVAIHGAAIGPMLYRSPKKQRLKFLEIFTPGHMTNYYRGMADQVGVDWIAVRGRIDAQHAAKAYTFSEPFLAHSLTSFEACTESIGEALQQLNISALASPT